MSLLEHDPDIYRGEPPKPQPLHIAPSIISTTTSASASSFLAAGRLGATAAKVELAISRWAKRFRGNSSDSSSSHSSSSHASIVTLARSQQSRRRSRRSSVSSVRSSPSQHDIATRILRMKALQESRLIPRQFALYVPPSIIPASQKNPQNQPSTGADPEKNQPDHSSITSTSLPLILNQLDLAIRNAGRQRRLRLYQRHRGNSSTLDSFALQTVHDDQSGPVYPRARQGRKGKNRESPIRAKSLPVIDESIAKPQAWFFDVANPTWADLRAIGKVRFVVSLIYDT